MRKFTPRSWLATVLGVAGLFAIACNSGVDGPNSGASTPEHTPEQIAHVCVSENEQTSELTPVEVFTEPAANQRANGCAQIDAHIENCETGITTSAAFGIKLSNNCAYVWF